MFSAWEPVLHGWCWKYPKTIIKRCRSVAIDLFSASSFQVLFSLNCLDSSGGW